MEATIELKGLPLLEVNPIERRANTKIVQMNGKSYLIGSATITQGEWLQKLSPTRSMSLGLIVSTSLNVWSGEKYTLTTIFLVQETLFLHALAEDVFTYGEDWSFKGLNKRLYQISSKLM